MRWEYIGCQLDLVPKELTAKSNKLTKNEIKSLLDAIPIQDGVLEAASIDQLVSVLIGQGIYPIKIRPCDKIDERIEILRSIRSRASTAKSGVREENLAQILPMLDKPEKHTLQYFLYAFAIVAAIAATAIYKLS